MNGASTWPSGPGVLELGDGTRVRGRALRKPVPEGPAPAFGLYLLGRRPPAMDWDTGWIVWPDFRTPRRPDDAVAALLDAHRRASSERVEIACGGGRGRTGTALACLAVIAGVPAGEAVAYVRERYDHRAVETRGQRRFVLPFPALLPGA